VRELLPVEGQGLVDYVLLGEALAELVSLRDYYLSLFVVGSALGEGGDLFVLPLEDLPQFRVLVLLLKRFLQELELPRFLRLLPRDEIEVLFVSALLQFLHPLVLDFREVALASVAIFAIELLN